MMRHRIIGEILLRKDLMSLKPIGEVVREIVERNQ